MGIPGTRAQVHSLICHVFQQMLHSIYQLLGPLEGFSLWCLLPYSNSVLHFQPVTMNFIFFLSFVAPHHPFIPSFFFFCSHTLPGDCGRRVFSFLRDWLRLITSGGKSTRKSDQLQALWEEYQNRACDQQYFPDCFHVCPLMCSLSEIGLVHVPL